MEWAKRQRAAPISPGTSDHLEASLSADLGVGAQKIRVSQNRIFAPKSPGTSDNLEASLCADLGMGAQNIRVSQNRIFAPKSRAPVIIWKHL